MRLSDYFTLYRLAKKRLYSESDYRQFQAFQAKLLLKYLRRFGVDVTGRIVLDLGSGLRGYSDELAHQGAKAVISLDLETLLPPAAQNVYPVVADALHIPLKDAEVELVFCASLIEHLASPSSLLDEIRRVLCPGGWCYLSFPPFYSLHGGHEFAPFHYFGERFALCVYRLLSRSSPEWVNRLYKPTTHPNSFSKLYPRWGLYRLTIRRVKQMLSSLDIDLIDLSTRYLPVNTARFPFPLSEVLTWHAQFLFRVKSNAHEDKTRAKQA